MLHAGWLLPLTSRELSNQRLIYITLMVTFVRLRENVELRNTRPQTCKSQEKGTAGMVRKYKLTGVRDGLVCMYTCV